MGVRASPWARTPTWAVLTQSNALSVNIIYQTYHITRLDATNLRTILNVRAKFRFRWKCPELFSNKRTFADIFNPSPHKESKYYKPVVSK